MSYLIIIVIGYFFESIVTITDKLLLDKFIPNPIVYTFYLGLLSSVSLLLIPFGFYLPSSSAIVFSILSGITFTLGWIIYYSVLKFDEASRVSPILGTLTALFTLPLASLLLPQKLTLFELVAFVLLVLGMIILSFDIILKSKLERKHLAYLLGAGFFYSASSVTLREAFINSSFIDGMVLSKLTVTCVVLTFLLLPKFRHQIAQNKIQKHHFINKTTRLLILGQISGGLGGLILAYSISLTNPVIVNSLQGVQYIFILIAVMSFSKKLQKFLEEKITRKMIIQKIIGSVLIASGLAVLATSI